MGIKVSEYLPFYGLLLNFDYQIEMNGKFISVNELFDKHPESKLNEYQIETLSFFDTASLVKVLKHEGFTKSNIQNYLRDLFDEYRLNEGDPVEWISFTWNSVYNNPTNYRSEIRTEIESFLLSLWEVYSKLNPPQNPPKTASKEFLTLAQSFNDKFGKEIGTQKLNDLKAKLYKKGVLSEDHSTWIGVGMDGKSQLASLIKFVGHKFLNKSLSEDQVIFISEKDFNNKVSKGTVKKGKAENAEFYFK